MSYLIRSSMDCLSRILFRISPARAGAWDAWCDSHGRWGRWRAQREKWEK